MTFRASNAVHQSLSVDTEAELGKLTTASLEDGDLVYVRATDQYWRLVKSSTATTSGNVKTCVSGGRWFLCFLAAPGGGFGVATIADLAALDAASMEDGSAVWVESVSSNFVLQSTAGTPDNITIVDAYNSTKYWYRSDARSLTWASQAAWYINNGTGSDENDGATALTPLKTFDEFRRRVYEVAVSMTVTIADAAYPGALIGEFSAKTKGLSLTINGTVTVVADGGTTTTFTDPVTTLGACAMGTATSGSIANFTAYTGKFLRAGANYFAPILGASGGGAPYLPFWARDTLSTSKPANNSQLDVVDITTVTTIQISVFGGLGLSLYYLKSTSTSFVDAVSTSNSNTVNGVVYFACEFGGYLTVSASTYAIACLLSGSGQCYFYQPLTFIGGGSRRTLELLEGGRVGFQGFVINGGAGFKMVGNVSGPDLPSTATLWGGGVGLGVFNSSAAGVTVYSGCFLNGTTVYGASNTTIGMIVDYGGRVQVTTAPTITGASDLSFGGAATAIPPLSGGAVVPAASALTTWAQLTGGTFNGHVVSYKNGSVLSVG